MRERCANSNTGAKSDHIISSWKNADCFGEVEEFESEDSTSTDPHSIRSVRF